jgi:hypothetical protein
MYFYKPTSFGGQRHVRADFLVFLPSRSFGGRLEITMKVSKRIFVLFAVATLAGVPFSRAQETEEPKGSGARIDSIVQNIFDRIDSQLGTYLFRDEPAPFADVSDTLEEPYDSFASYAGNSSRTQRRRWRGREPSLYSFDPNRGIARNLTVSYPWEQTHQDLLFRYNRVEGLFLGLSSPPTYRWRERHITVFGSAGYGFAAHRWLYNGGVAQQFGAGKSMIEFGVEGHILTDTRDQWIISEEENTLTVLFLHDDYRDYFGRKGFSLWTGTYWRWRNSDLQFRVVYLNDRYESLQQKTDWSIFGGEKRFRSNPAVNEGRMNSILTTLEFHQSRPRRYFFTGWSASASAEFSPSGLKGDFDFNRYLLDLRSYLSLDDYENVNVRFRAASVTGDVPVQKGLDLGGLGTLPAFGFKEFVGNRLLFANAEYIINGKILDEAGWFPSWLLRNLNFILFADAGYVRTVGAEESFLNGFDGLNSDTINWDWGLGIGSRDGKMRLAFAWRTDVAKPAKVFIRVSRPF